MGTRLGALSLLLAALLLATAAADKPPAQYQSAGSVSGGVATENMVINGVRFGEHSESGTGDYTRMVLDLAVAEDHAVHDASTHPVYEVTYREFPYRLVVKLQDVRFDPQANITSKPALPFAVIAREDGSIKEIQIYLPGPCDFKVIEIDDPAKLAIDIRRNSQEIPKVYAVQLPPAGSASEAFALVESGALPPEFQPAVLVLGEVVIIEQVFTDAVAAAAIDAQLHEMGYASLINERRGDELPQA